MGREEARKSNAIATPKRQKSWKHRKHLEKGRFSIFMGLLSPICCVLSGSFIQRIVFHQCYSPTKVDSQLEDLSQMQNPNRSLSTSGHRSPRVGQGTDPTGVCLSRADGWNECWASLYISQPFGGFRHERSHVLCVNVACV